jgi:hypothetical protein
MLFDLEKIINLNFKLKNVDLKIPWSNIFCSTAVWAIVGAHFGKIFSLKHILFHQFNIFYI